MESGKLSFAKDFVIKLAPALHDGTKHLIICAASEENLASI